jgi:hypothetical protein
MLAKHATRTAWKAGGYETQAHCLDDSSLGVPMGRCKFIQSVDISVELDHAVPIVRLIMQKREWRHHLEL